MSKEDLTLLLLDTHIWVWFMMGDSRLQGGRGREAIDRAVQKDKIRVSVISAWEVGMLESKGRIELPMDCLSWVGEALSKPGTSLAPITPEIAVAASRLPGEFHGDPADRLIVATARALGATLITEDRKILAYGKQKFLKAMSALN